MQRRTDKSEAVTKYWLRFFAPFGHCSLCGNSGKIDTRGKVHTSAGRECGDLTYCICPNGQTMRFNGAPLTKASTIPTS